MRPTKLHSISVHSSKRQLHLLSRSSAPSVWMKLYQKYRFHPDKPRKQQE
jgi:hypothetical protein